MGVYIKGMEMPTSCAECRFYGEHCYAKGDENKYSNLPCPLVPVPEHGRLIDADALMLEIKEYIEEYGEKDEHGWHNEKWCAMKEAEMAINNAKTVFNSTR